MKKKTTFAVYKSLFTRGHKITIALWVRGSMTNEPAEPVLGFKGRNRVLIARGEIEVHQDDWFFAHNVPVAEMRKAWGAPTTLNGIIRKFSGNKR